MEYIFLFIVFFLGSAIHGATGFGYGIFTMSLLPLILPFKTASIIVLLFGEIMCFKIAYSLRKHVNLKVILPTVLAGFVGSAIGVYGLMNLKGEVLKIILGVVLIILSIYFYIFKNKIKIAPSTRNGVIAGLLSGVLDGMLNMGGPPMVLYFYCALEDTKEYIASLQAAFIASGTYILILHFLHGNFTTSVLKYAVSGMIAILAGTSIGLWIFKRTKKENLSKAIYTFMAVMGIILIFK